MSLLSPPRRPLLMPAWSRNDLWRRAAAVPSLDLNFAAAKALAPLVTFTRASTATFINSAGVLQTATTNLLLRSEEFDNAYWVPSGSSITANNTTAPNGTITADLLIENSASSTHLVFIGGGMLSGTTYTYSVYAKAAGRDWLIMSPGSSWGYGWFNINNGTLGTLVNGGSNPTAAINAVGNGWYRCSITLTAVANADIQFLMAPSNGTVTYTGNGTSGIYLWGAQLERSATVGDYVPTTSTTNSAPRFDHNPTTGESLGLLVEEQRTNLHLQSENLSGYAFTASGAGDALTNFYGTAADGTSSKTLRVQTGSSARVVRWVDNGCGIDATSTQYTVSFFYRGSLPSVAARAGAAVASTVIYAPSAGLMGRAQAVITSGTNGAAFLDLGYSANGNGELWGVQVEKSASFSTSYIPTTTAAATRSADVASITGTAFSSWYRQDEGTVFADVTRQTTTGFPGRVRFSDGTAANAIDLYYDAANNSSTFEVKASSTSSVAIFGGGGALNSSVKAAAGWQTNNAAVTYNGSIQGTDSSVVVPVVDQARIGNSLTGTIRRLTYWPARLPDTTLQAITQP